ncbi:hypothetical protein [Patulibacter sp.]|uniref:hypothetical protein n=1 Tax=Patulibacter sp. TaxID=1912859 RepID=UPI002721CDEA|nr:hypothetical protein [Patulibacter sp.]MDO9408807.1 hypothetical protein [Patulibacter sp.]
MPDAPVPLRLLALDHFFDQDLAALRAALGPGESLRVLDYRALREEAMRVFPEAVASGLEAFAADEHAGAREGWAGVVREILEDEFTREPFDALVLPSDIFFYVRAAREACHALGVPFFVVQKETTISPNTMREHAAHVQRYAPPIADHMTVCSEHHKEFWLNAGAAATTITVTGQPRFDLFAHPERWPARAPDAAPTVLFLSYMVDAYHPTDGQGEPAWERLHRQTEEGLRTLADDGWRVLVKPHPQQDVSGMRARLAQTFGDHLGRTVVLVDGAADVRPLIFGADAVVGFQSTAMLEAMLAGGPVAYTAWDPEARKLAGELLPFAEWPELLDVVDDPARLAPLIDSRRGWRADPATAEGRRRVSEIYLGPLDGGAARRALDVVGQHARAAAAARNPEAQELRRALAARRRPLRPGRRLRAARRSAGRALLQHRQRRAARAWTPPST